ncbi:hypothetical protein [Micromonospora maritima]|uniref:hypothetical protein n=1 Tax=Micromonospora maritima TaxID=986711 RepID=UPI001C2DD8FF|nr:hypothetical protein [Micromonospora maritima]
MTDKLYPKFEVRRTDGRDGPGGDKAGARYFVLDYVNDPKARVALAAYADAVADEEPGLAADLRALVADVVVLSRRCIAGREAIKTLLAQVADRGLAEARAGAGGGFVAWHVLVEALHVGEGHAGPGYDCQECLNEATVQLGRANLP